MTSALVNGGLTYGSSIVPARTGIIASPVWGVRTPYRPVSPPISPAWGAGGYPWGGAPLPASPGSFYNGTSPSLPTSTNNLAQLTLQYQSNPASLTPLQWSQLQAAGVIPGTVPYSNSSLVSTPSSSSAIDPATGQTYASELAAAQSAAATPAATSSVMGVDPVNGATTIFGVDWYYLAGAGLLLMFAFSGKRGR